MAHETNADDTPRSNERRTDERLYIVLVVVRVVVVVVGLGYDTREVGIGGVFGLDWIGFPTTKEASSNRRGNRSIDRMTTVIPGVRNERRVDVDGDCETYDEGWSGGSWVEPTGKRRARRRRRASGGDRDKDDATDGLHRGKQQQQQKRAIIVDASKTTTEDTPSPGSASPMSTLERKQSSSSSSLRELSGSGGGGGRTPRTSFNAGSSGASSPRGTENGVIFGGFDGERKQSKRFSGTMQQERRHSPGEKRLTYGPHAIWFAILACGALIPGAGRPGAKEAAIASTKWFDDIFVTYGPLLPLTCTLARWWSSVTWIGVGRNGTIIGTCSHLKHDMEVYVIVALLRVALYAALTRMFPSTFMSDHVFLAASVFTTIHGEVLSCAVDFLILVERREKPFRRTLIMCVALYGLFLLSCVGVESYVTARYFHKSVETLVASVFGWFALQLPLVAHIVRPRARALAAALAL